mgnify:CR=1 FL=1
MRTKSWICLFVLIIFLFPVSMTAAQDKVVVIPLFDDDASCCACEGTLNGTRWCDNGDGTVTDLSTCLVWLKNANCTETLAGIIKADGWLEWDDATIWSSAVINGACGLSDGSTGGDWRLPTKNELYTLATGTEAVRSSTPRAIVGVESSGYWTSTTLSNKTDRAWIVDLEFGGVAGIAKFIRSYVWPVRSGN